jgi:hypothetical protein
LNLFKTILADQKSLPREQPYKDLVSLITFILRQFFKAITEDSFLAIEVRNLNSLPTEKGNNNIRDNRLSFPKTVVIGNNFLVGNPKRRPSARRLVQLKTQDFRLMCRSRRGTLGVTNSVLLSLLSLRKAKKS